MIRINFQKNTIPYEMKQPLQIMKSEVKNEIHCPKNDESPRIDNESSELIK